MLLHFVICARLSWVGVASRICSMHLHAISLYFIQTSKEVAFFKYISFSIRGFSGFQKRYPFILAPTNHGIDLQTKSKSPIFFHGAKLLKGQRSFLPPGKNGVVFFHQKLEQLQKPPTSTAWWKLACGKYIITKTVSRAFLERGTHEYARCLVVWYRRSWISDVEANDLVFEMYPPTPR